MERNFIIFKKIIYTRHTFSRLFSDIEKPGYPRHENAQQK